MECFTEKVYRKLRQVPRGKVTTYKLLAQALKTKAYRAVGVALSKNPYAPEVPCHRVIASNGTIGGFMGKKDGEMIVKKIKMLKDEGIAFVGNRVKDFEKVLYKF